MENQEMNPVSPEINEEQTADMPTILAQEEPVIEEEIIIELEVTEDTTPDPVINLENVMSMFDELNQKFEKKIAHDSHKNALFDKMYAELDLYKNDLYKKILKPFVMDTIMLIDDTNKLIRDMEKTDAEKVFKALSGIPNDLLEILERAGIEAFHEDSDTFNPKTQRVLKTVPTDDPELANKIESRIRQGYRWDEKIINPEIIQCYKHSS